MKKLAFLWLLLPSLAFATPPMPSKVDVSEVDGLMRAYITVKTSSPTITVTGQGPGPSDAYTLGTLDSTHQSISFYGPWDTLSATVSGGTAEVSFCGRVSAGAP